MNNGDVENVSRRDPLICKVLLYTSKGWPVQVSDSQGPFYTRRYELTAEGNCLLWGTRVVIPSCLRELLLKELHQGHPGISRMKALARSYLWWPNLDKDIKHVAGSCSSCQTIRQTPPRAPMHPWTWPLSPWHRVHVDFAGPFEGKMFFLSLIHIPNGVKCVR